MTRIERGHIVSEPEYVSGKAVSLAKRIPKVSAEALEHQQFLTHEERVVLPHVITFELHADRVVTACDCPKGRIFGRCEHPDEILRVDPAELEGVELVRSWFEKFHPDGAWSWKD